jgi:hypothetical protein
MSGRGFFYISHKKEHTPSMETEDGLPATKGELRALTASVDATNARIDATNARLDATNADLNKLVLEMKSNRTGVEQDGPIIPAADTVVAEETRFSLFSQAVLRHKGCRVRRVVIVLKHSKKRV